MHTLEIVEVEENVKAQHKEVRLFADLFCFMGISFVYATSRNVGFRTTGFILKRQSPSLKKTLMSVFDARTNNGFNVKIRDIDLEF